MCSDDWPTTPLGDLTENLDSLRIPVKEAERRPGPYPYYGASGVVDYIDKYIFEGEHLLVAEDGENLRTRNTPVAFLANGKFWVNNHAHVVRGNNRASTRFLCYALARTDISPYLTGAVMPKLTQGNLNRIPIIEPPKAAQESIVDILGTLDEKIELNRRMNRTLEAIAQAIFKSWFVDFDPVRAKADAKAAGAGPAAIERAAMAAIAGRSIEEAIAEEAYFDDLTSSNRDFLAQTAALFPENFQDSELGEIPERWNTGNILKENEVLSGGTPKTSEPTYWDGGVMWASAKDVSQCGEVFLIDTERTITNLGLTNSSTKLIPKFCTVVVSRGATTGRLTIFGGDIAMNQTCYAIRSKNMNHFYCFCHSKHFIDSVVAAGHGSVFNTITIKTFEASSAILADSNAVTRFEGIVAPAFRKILRNLQESRTLANLRDTLLPKLLSGEISVPEAESQIETAID